MAVTHKYINIYKQRGKDIGAQLRLNRDVNKIVVKKSVANLATALLCTGSAPDGSDIPVTLSGYKYDDGDFYVEGNYLKSRKAVAQWSRYVWADEPGKLAGHAGHVVKTFTYDTVSQEELCKQAITELKKACTAEVNYEAEITRLPNNIRVGDRVNIIDEEGQLYLSARILALETCVAENTRTATLGEYLIKDSGISQKVQELAKQFSEMAQSRTLYTWIAYADDVEGNGITLDPANKKYMGTAINKLTDAPDLSKPEEYRWVLIKGADGNKGEQGERGPQGLPGPQGLQGVQGPEGKQGIPGTKGADGKNTYFHIKYSAVEAPTTADQMTETPSEFIGTYVDDTAMDSTDPKKYTWSRFQGIQGDKGENGIPGKNGANGQTSYLHIKYSDDGGTTFTANNGETPGDYIGVRTDFVQADSTNVKDYVWSQTKGEKGDKGDRGLQGLQGAKGDQGIQGPKGTDGKTSYTHIAYANSSDGQIDFSVSDSNRKYIGMYVDFEATDSTTPSKYEWSLIKGADGAQGTPGKAGADGKTPYLHIAYANSADGKTGFSVSVSTNKLYIGQYTDYTSADSTDPTKYAWTKIKGDTGDAGPQGPQGATGPQGVQGPKGADGKQLYTWLKYADTPTTGMSDSPAGKAYIGLAYNKTTAAESSNYGDYTWSLVKGEKGDQGVAGGKGADGKTLYTWVKYATSASGANMSDSPAGKTYIGLAYNKTTATESTNASDYTWSLIKGEKGEPGSPGANGTPARTYMVESLVSLVKKSIADQLTPSSLTFNSYYRDGNGAAKTAYTGKLIVSESTNGSTFVNKTTVASGNAITHKITSASTTHIKCTLYSGTTALAATTVMVVADSDAIALQWCHDENKTMIDGEKIFTGSIGAERISVKSLETICAKIGGFNIGAAYLANNTNILAGAANSVYLGTNGISCGKKFKVLADGTAYMSNANIEGGMLDIRGDVNSNPNYKGFVKILNGQLLVGYDATAEGGPRRNVVELNDAGIVFYNPYDQSDMYNYEKFLTYENVPQGNQLLWSGSYWMLGVHTITLNKPISRQSNGIVLMFSAYNTDTNKAEAWGWMSFFIPKISIELCPGSWHYFFLTSEQMGRPCGKTIKINDKTIVGNDANKATGTMNGIKYDNRKFVLRYVIGV